MGAWGDLVAPAGIEPATDRLSSDCSTALFELQRHKQYKHCQGGCQVAQCGTLEKAVCAIVVKGLYIRGGGLTSGTPTHPPT